MKGSLYLLTTGDKQNTYCTTIDKVCDSAILPSILQYILKKEPNYAQQV